jgi:hypothetical protein
MHDLAASRRDGSASFWRAFSLRPFESSSSKLVGVGVSIAVGYLLLHTAFDVIVLAVWGVSPGELSWWQRDGWWTDLVNAAIFGYLPAAQAVARRGVVRDLAELRPQLRGNDAEINALSDRATGLPGPIARACGLSGLAFGTLIVFADPSASTGASASLGDPRFVWSLGRVMLVVWLIARFSVYDFNVTRTYVAMCRSSIDIDLLDIGSLAPFAKRGQRSALTWVLFLSIFSLFWLGDNTAARANVWLLLMVFSMATYAFVGPLAALRQGIRAEKHSELERLREEIREARAQTDAAVDSPRLANLVGYYQLIDSAREWPVDAANQLKFIAYLLLGLGSWLGGALVERVLDSAIRG